MQRYRHGQDCTPCRGGSGAGRSHLKTPRHSDLGRGAERPSQRCWASLSLGGTGEGKVGFPPSSILNVFVFFLLGAGRVPAPDREKERWVSAALPQTPWRSSKASPRCVDVCVCTEGEARPQPRTTHNSVHSRLSFLQNLLPEETSAMAGVERGWGLREWASCVCQKAPMAGSAAGPAPGGHPQWSHARAELLFVLGKTVSASLLSMPSQRGSGPAGQRLHPSIPQGTPMSRGPRNRDFCPYGRQPVWRPS